MIETYTFRHMGGDTKQREDIFVRFGSSMCIEILNGSLDPDFEACALDVVNLNNSFDDNSKFDDILDQIDKKVNNRTSYMILRITDNSIEVFNNSTCKAYIIKNGEIKTIPNGYNGIEDGDKIICGTENFFKTLTPEAVLIDAVSSISSEEWIDFLITRISQKTKLSQGNIAAASFIVRGEEKLLSVEHLNRKTS